ncbi:MAG: PHB depolymerase family esterase [Myxococcaceae bacterium]|nr:PHB depolymerase family esterase [Myxococcaceae bacterium]
MKHLRLPALVAVLVLTGSVCWTCAHWAGPVAGTSEGRLVHGDRERRYLAFIPEGRGPFPLVVALHGRLGSGAQMLKLSGLVPIAQREGFVLIAPDGIGRSWADGRGTSPASKAGVDDVGFLVALVGELVTKHPVDPSRVYAVGMSNGGFMALTLACRAPETFAAAGSVTGFMGTEFAKTCAPTRPVPVMIVAGDTDPIVPFAGGQLEGGRGHILGAEATFATWRELDGCETVPTITAVDDRVPDDGTTVERREVVGCRGGSAVRLDVVKGGGHTWPRGDRYLPESVIGKTSEEFDASEALWAFLKAFRR